MHLASALLLAAAGVSAHPSGHAHGHARFHAKRDEVKKRDVYITATIDNKVVSWIEGGSPFQIAQRPNPTPPAQVAPTLPVAPAVPTDAAPVGNVGVGGAPGNAPGAPPGGGPVGLGLAAFQPFAPCGAVKKRATLAEIAYQGNTGCNGYGTNVKLIQSHLADKYDYTIKVVSSGAEMECKVWNKIGPTGGINGFFNGNEALSFHLPAGGEQFLAFDKNSQSGFTCGAGGVPLTGWGQFGGPWGEVDFENQSNGGWSGFDASQLVAGATGMPQKALTLCRADNSVCSTLYEGGGGANAFLPGDEAKDGIGGNITPGPLHLVAKF